MIQEWHVTEAARTIARLGDRLDAAIGPDPARRRAFRARLGRHLPRLLGALHRLYGWHYDFFWHLEQILTLAARAAADRPADLAALDAECEAAPAWFLDHRALGAVCYVDRFAGDLAGLRARLPYFRSLGITYLHLMPLFRSPPGENDGGYAVSSYREVDPALGSMAELADLARAFRAAGISLVVDFILNHTADDHPWAEAAKAGDADAQGFYWLYDDRRLPDRYQPWLRAIFPERGGDSFTWRPDIAGPAPRAQSAGTPDSIAASFGSSRAAAFQCQFTPQTWRSSVGMVNGTRLPPRLASSRPSMSRPLKRRAS